MAPLFALLDAAFVGCEGSVAVDVIDGAVVVATDVGVEEVECVAEAEAMIAKDVSVDFK